MDTTCCIVGGGPAGTVLGLLLARAGLDVVVLEKHADFLRDFRGDTIHPSTLDVLDELGLKEEFLRIPHQPVPEARAAIGDQEVTLVDFRVLGADRIIRLMPQWDFLNFVSAEAKRYPSFRLEMNAEVTGLLREGGRVAGVRVERDGEVLEVRADLTVACDGRNSVVREAARLPVKDFGAPIDVLWFRVPREPSDPAQTFGRAARGLLLIFLNRAEYWQVAFVLAKGSLPRLKAAGLEAFRASLLEIAPFLGKERVATIASWDDVKLLTVQVNRARRWHRPGLLLIGDAAHAMSPVAGVGINLAVQDAVAAANLLAGPLARRAVTEADLARVQRRRMPPTVVTQAAQRLIQSRVLRPVISERPPQVPTKVFALTRPRPVQRLLARAIALGVRPEHVTVKAAR